MSQFNDTAKIRIIMAKPTLLANDNDFFILGGNNHTVFNKIGGGNDSLLAVEKYLYIKREPMP